MQLLYNGFVGSVSVTRKTFELTSGGNLTEPVLDMVGEEAIKGRRHSVQFVGRTRRRSRKPSAWGYNRATLFLGDINTGTWSSRLGESQIWDSKRWS
jgi:hypothetical protein